MKKEDIIAGLCELASMVGSEVYKDRFAHDCFCDPKPDPFFQFDNAIFEFIDVAIRMAIAERRNES